MKAGDKVKIKQYPFTSSNHKRFAKEIEELYFLKEFTIEKVISSRLGLYKLENMKNTIGGCYLIKSE